MRKNILHSGLIIVGLVLIFAVPGSPQTARQAGQTATTTAPAVRTPVRGDQPAESVLAGTSDIVEVPAKKQAVFQKIEARRPVPVKNLTLVAGSAKYSFATPEDATLYEGMQALASTTSFIFTSKKYQDLGYLIESINGKANADGFYWTLYINGAYATVGASTYIPKSNDIIAWKYEKL